MGAHTLPEDMLKANDRFGSVDDGNDLTFSGETTFTDVVKPKSSSCGYKKPFAS